jgi:4-hydroxyphenylpyruvate dioxygenase
MYTSIATVSLSGTLREKLEAIALAGFSGVELFENDLISFDGTIDDIRQFVADVGLEIVLFQPFRDFEAMPEPYRKRNFERARRKFDLMNRLGVDLILVCSNVSPKCLGGIDRSAEDFLELGELAKAFNIRVGYEALAWGKFVNDYRDAWEIVRRIDHPNIGTIIDSFHILTRKHDLSTLRAIPKDRIFLVQIADAPSLDMDILSLSRHFRSFPGQGNLPLTDFMTAVQATGYDGIYSLEIFNDRFRAAPVQQTATDGRRSLIFLDEQANHVVAPERPEFGHIEFVEFALNEETAQALREVLKGMGFYHWGMHRTKSVEVWKNGDVHLVINLEPDSFAQSYNLMNGSSVCAVGLHVSDAKVASHYAEKYLCKKIEQSMFPNEMQVPAIRNLDESLIYFIDDQEFPDTIWNAEFELTSEGAAASMLTHIDHIAQLMPPAQLPSWLLFYHSVFGFKPTQPLDIADPAGLIQSQVVESSGQQVRIVLNTSQNQDTLASRFLTEHIVGGIQHIAFYTDRMFEVAEQFIQQGVALLPIPENYYEDLEARFDLDLDFLSQLKKYNILYDRSEDGDFFQIYTQTIANRFFFEVVERRNYEGYGASNTPVRLAAQARLSQPRYPIAYENSSVLVPQKVMQAAMLTAPKQIHITSVPVPVPRYGEVRIKMKSVGICGSDIHLFSGHRPDLIYPKIIGHEGYGYVEMLGEGVKHLTLGDRVVIEPNYPCMKCEFCLQGRGNICPNKRIIGVLEQGCFAEYAVVPEPFAWRVPQTIMDDDAVVIEPTAVALHAIHTSSRAYPGDTIAVVGLGAIGMLVTHIALQLGYRVVVTDSMPQKAAFAENLGAIISAPNQWETQDVVAIIECSGSADALSLAIEKAPRGAEIIVVGLAEKTSVFSEFQLARRGLSLVPSMIYDHPRDFKRTIQLIAAGKINPSKIISRRLTFSHVDEALEIASQGLDTKVIMDLS